MERALARYLRHHRAANSSPKTIQNYVDSLERSLFGFLRQQGHSLALGDLKQDDVQDWIEDQQARGLSQKTISTRVIAVKAWAHWLTEEGYVSKDPLARLKRPKVDIAAKDVLSPADVEKLLATCNRRRYTGARDYAIMLLLYSTGLRASEVLALEQGDIDWGHGLITVRRGKGGKFRQVPLGAAVERALDKCLNHPKRPESAYLFPNEQGGMASWDTLYLSLQRKGRQAGIVANPHKWRHSFAIQYLRNGGTIEALKAILGHTTLDMSLHYARLAGVDLAKAHETADPARSLKIR